MLRTLFAIAATLVLTLVLGTPALALSLVHPRGDWVLRFGRLWARGICAASGVSIESRGVENVPATHSTILISNHASYFDVLALVLTMPCPFRFVAKKELFRIPIFGWCLSAAGMIPIERDKRSRAIESLEKANELVREGRPVLFFPEGTRSSDGALSVFKKGAFVIAVKSQVPIVPVSIAGSFEVQRKGSSRIRPGRITVMYGREIPVAGYTFETKEALIRRVRDAVEEGLAELDPGRHARVQAGTRR